MRVTVDDEGMFRFVGGPEVARRPTRQTEKRQASDRR
jgi:hypothetical protein